MFIPSGVHPELLLHRMIEYQGQAFASSVKSLANSPDKAFCCQVNKATKWISSNIPFPHKVWFRFEHQVVLAKIGFAAVGLFNPVKFDVIAADDCTRVNTIFYNTFLSVRNTGFNRDRIGAKSWIIPRENRRLHLCWGLKIYSSVVSSRTQVGTSNILMWEAKIWD